MSVATSLAADRLPYRGYRFHLRSSPTLSGSISGFISVSATCRIPAPSAVSSSATRLFASAALRSDQSSLLGCVDTQKVVTGGNRICLISDCEGNVAAIEAAAHHPCPPGQRLTAVDNAFRAWALDYPNAYRRVYQSTSGSGQDLAPERTIPAASRSMASSSPPFRQRPVTASSELI